MGVYAAHQRSGVSVSDKKFFDLLENSIVIELERQKIFGSVQHENHWSATSPIVTLASILTVFAKMTLDKENFFKILSIEVSDSSPLKHDSASKSSDSATLRRK